MPKCKKRYSRDPRNAFSVVCACVRARVGVRKRERKTTFFCTEPKMKLPLFVCPPVLLFALWLLAPLLAYFVVGPIKCQQLHMHAWVTSPARLNFCYSFLHRRRKISENENEPIPKLWLISSGKKKLLLPLLANLTSRKKWNAKVSTEWLSYE